MQCRRRSPTRATDVAGGAAVGPRTANEPAALLPIARPEVSRHLRVLREAGLVDVEADAQRRSYRLRPESLAEVEEWLAPYRDLWTPARGRAAPPAGSGRTGWCTRRRELVPAYRERPAG